MIKFLRICIVVLVLVLGLQTLFLQKTPTKSVQAQSVSRPNVILILTDDQSFRHIPNMPFLSSLPGGHWVKFDNAFVSVPLCCPSRASILSGQYSFHHGVKNLGGGAFKDASALPTWLKSAGYNNALVGKYLNGYPFKQVANYIPPGWDYWVSFKEQAYYNYSLNENGTYVNYGSTAADYSTDVLKNKALTYLQTAPQPFFLWFGTQAPHQGFTPAPRHATALSTYPIPRLPNFNEADVSDKPAWVRARKLYSNSDMTALERNQRGAMRTLLAVDEALQAMMNKLTERGMLDNTVIIFMSDNGYSFGAHRWKEKRCVYEECVRTPMLVRYPWTESRTETRLVENIDIAPTILELAQASTSASMDGRSFVPLLNGTASNWRQSVLLEYLDKPTSSQPPRQFYAVHTGTWKYAELDTGEKELYDLVNDPYELENKANKPEFAAMQASLSAELVRLKGQ